MQFERIEELKEQYTDRYVVVDASRPELARFQGVVGQVKTVNCNGRALVQFDTDNNQGWYDIELDFLKVVDKPEPKPAETKEKPAAAAKAAPKKAAAGPAEENASPLKLAQVEREGQRAAQGEQ
ncbi:MAG: hypothetical protein HUU20_26500 [Pirellulales bacterium]|nr:hypothetical protein [Pirellulales bacterium]